MKFPQGTVAGVVSRGNAEHFQSKDQLRERMTSVFVDVAMPNGFKNNAGDLTKNLTAPSPTTLNQKKKYASTRHWQFILALEKQCHHFFGPQFVPSIVAKIISMHTFP